MWRIPLSPRRYPSTISSTASSCRRLKSTHTPKTSFTSARKGETKIRVSQTPAAPTSNNNTAQPPPHIGPPRLIRYPPPDTRFSLSKAPVSRLFAYYNAATATSTGRGSQQSPSTASSPSTSFLPNRKQDLPIIQSSPSTMSTSTSLNQTKGETLRKRSAVETNGEHSHGATSSWLPHAHTHSHSHSHGAEGSAEEADRLLAALKGKGDRGSNITVIGLIANLILCGTKGLAGVWLHSASLLADAAHSLSDTFSDVVTLFCWKMSQKPASVTHPMGYGKFETMGGLGVSVVLVGGAFAIGMHSYGLLLEVLQPALQNAPSGLKALGSWTGDLAKMAGGLLHDHHNAAGAAIDAGETAKANLGHEQSNLLDPNAMWFALISILVKEWLYRATLKIAKEENSSVLEANAIHHRSDSLSSGVTFLAIGGSYLGFPVLDPLGGLLVAGLIGKQGAELLIGALHDLSDRGVQPEVLEGFESALKEVMAELEESASNADATRLMGWTDLRAIRSGVSSFVDVTLVMSEETKLMDARVVEGKVREKIMAAHKGVKEVRIQLDTESRSEK